ncbi:MAG: undecaprenyldiphospho-muramoylpentapeptide beta-N-acetylglucosaminyltransferase [Candidatus Schekmanbacteria bacterium RIFCSPHIGHO2_02_FULL_38_11]|uniref:UDP-N-acetylglucosamine--N-acetylmuramyl-(pentapeptide) pyrophosphoryl-undecaprenol N-acetylglucosamine transferase n=1 Tax=Candidatus Schekmanbacteria bacterium RIFCSPLOWO2_12_FULL_38_15 TaxID=1817883 RepID=A0A1F7SGZ8_9BACT|nr:MAG: undecaprenyldiphospho-muramoylpentapeptide beta-N-acetylglucosaminyltransferase [Candidatus Schekmanbacteria bacterium GWA2_38_9]OGL49698.1 MAG: undecaprenyldiphospho-muramoylpentapeptide beta-N-acetylglucosaminyltransferase [Candidatus Schekmanbacteria bacterium RIFCSPLOWO2_02_FULL_38_14]OGL51051.1 MAG: undecaprenyldiphospho-muramoylpentapeptide beta-N-acetylglucosaminyltransferase [Candidatus Schekmanbacteria bacterium RIFCSPHIGHO2_02_FULL_38_11]OGL53052.1 MAG: undecaprenyldiphospho-mu
MRAIIAGGGTGGHIYPGIAIANEIKKRKPDSEILFVGTASGLEARIIPAHGMNLKLIEASGIKEKSLNDMVKGILKIPMGFFQAMKIIFSFRPDIVIGVGGYASGPTVFCAAMLRLPTIILEQNFYPGLTNRILSKVVKRVGVNFESSTQFFKKEKVVVAGNPVRRDINRGSREEALKQWGMKENCFTLLVFGGSQGARRINQCVVQALPILEKYSDMLQIVHQTGKNDFGFVKEEYNKNMIRNYVTPYIEEMKNAYAIADLVVCRAGAITLSELSECGKASILIPFPYAANNHQELNARAFADENAALMVLDKELNGEILSEKIISLITRGNKINELSRNSSKFSKGDAAATLVDACEELIRG